MQSASFHILVTRQCLEIEASLSNTSAAPIPLMPLELLSSASTQASNSPCVSALSWPESALVLAEAAMPQ
jgi:hypothetical protein